ncbi:homoserine dehydrogenase [Secundilactobacillus kimchicus]|uniref:Homoserine dehydrogenase n=2 Tax=Secundilactobacillus TaxID=2767892 RepID=A0A0R1HYI5_9LACO|nr:homoserine dehydrogenase [Secundilactobacillus kimchicus]KRK48562.1 homoserine dehydrogenase [Secundilactobacillus kimchicus JCM 15530]
MEDIKIGLVGLGTVGSGVLQMLTSNQDKIANITGRSLTVKTIVVHNIDKPRTVDLTGIQLTSDLNAIMDDPEIQIVVEVMGGIHPAKEIITQLLQAGKHVVTANKDLIANAGEELATTARDTHTDLMYEASVAGGIPILRTIVNSFAADHILEVKGIVNGTTNYILTQMQQHGRSYEEALQQAQKLGFAEADPTNDVAGIDAAYKMIILSQFAFGTQLSLDKMAVTGIDNVQLDDVTQAAELGYTVKLLGVAKRIDDGVFAEVAPVLVPSDHPLATINNENNAVMVTGQAVGETLFYGPGAGGLPTANSVLSDIISESKNIALGTTGNGFNNYQTQTQYADPADILYPYYLSLSMPDIPGQMLKLTQIMTNIGASFKQIVQTDGPEQRAKVMVITHAMSKAQLAELKIQLAATDDVTLLAAYKVLD